MKQTKMEMVEAHMNFVKEVEELCRKVLKLRMYNLDSTTCSVPQFRRQYQDAIDAADTLLKGLWK